MGDPLAHIQTISRVKRPFPSRPDHSSADPVQLWTNYFKMAIGNPDLVLYLYDMSFEAFPPEGSTPPDEEIPVPKGKKLIQVIRCALNTPTFTDISSEIATDFGKTLVSCKKFGKDKLKTEQFQFRAENEIKPRTDATRFQMTLTETEKTPVSDLTSFLVSGGIGEGGDKNIKPIMHALDIILGHYGKLSLNIATPKRGKSFPLEPSRSEEFRLAGPKMNEGYLRGIYGFFASVRATTNQTLVNCNACCGAFYKSISLVEFFGLFNVRQNSFPSREQLKNLEKAIQGLRVELTHLKNDDNTPIRSIIGFARSYGGPEDVEFDHEKDGKTYTVAAYWKIKSSLLIASAHLIH